MSLCHTADPTAAAAVGLEVRYKKGCMETSTLTTLAEDKKWFRTKILSMEIFLGFPRTQNNLHRIASHLLSSPIHALLKV
jgi:hypothetical protein